MISVRAAKQGGFSIVELMVAVTISLIMFAVIIELFASNKEAYRIQEGSSVLNENARFAVSHLQYFMRLADHWGGIEADNVSVDAGVPSPLATDCTGAAVVSNVGFRGFNGAASAPLDCITAANYEPGTDAFFIRYGAAHEDARAVSDTSVPVLNGVPSIPDDSEEPIKASYFGSANGGGLWVRTVLGRRSVIFQNTDLAALDNDIYSAADPDPLSVTNYRFQSMLYYIRACSNPASGSNAGACDSGDDGVPTLVRMTLNPDLSFTEQDVVAGVEDMQLLYGVDDDEDFVAESYETAANVQASGDWDKVVSVRVSLIVANVQRDNTITDTKTYYTLDTTFTPPAEARNFRRQQFDFTVQIRNMTRA